jgi:sec-independent protein translocase protein TatB
MFDIGWTELLIIGVVALIVIGPRDLPEMFRTLGRVTAKLRSMAREFQRAMESAADEAGVKDVAKDLKSVANPKGLGIDAVKDAAAKFEKWDPLKNAARPTPPGPTPPPMPPAGAPVVALGPGAAKIAEAPGTGPATRALAEAAEARRAIARDAAEALRSASADPAPAAAEGPDPARIQGARLRPQATDDPA